MTTETVQINPTIIKAFVHSTKNVLSTMANTQCTIGKPYLKEKNTSHYDVSGIVGFTGEIIGSVVISFTSEMAIKLVEQFTGENYTADSDYFADAVGELSNMIAGNAKSEFGLTAGISIPSVIIGTNHSVARMSDVPCVVIPCETPYGKMAVEVNVKCVG
ncbi:MAG: chemotaxis protein CheX [Sedimentisphaerales bacterium]|nr:chemotaxis protein CheX [Sedimentisphaerales bacterium]MBN2843404.1 chemotaxis protein CheX [Sedimentisphaerales bacterium]